MEISETMDVSPPKTPKIMSALERKLQERAIENQRNSEKLASEAINKARNALTTSQMIVLSSLPPNRMVAEDRGVRIEFIHHDFDRLSSLGLVTSYDGYVWRNVTGDSFLKLNDIAPLFSVDNLRYAAMEGNAGFNNNKNGAHEMEDVQQFEDIKKIWSSICDQDDVHESFCHMASIFYPVRIYSARVKGRDAIVLECESPLKHKDDPFVVMLLNPYASTPKAAMARYIETKMLFQHRLMVRLALSSDEEDVHPIISEDVPVAVSAPMVVEPSMMEVLTPSAEEVSVECTHVECTHVECTHVESPLVVANISEVAGGIEESLRGHGDVIQHIDAPSQELLRAMYSAIDSLKHLAEMIEKSQNKVV